MINSEKKGEEENVTLKYVCWMTSEGFMYGELYVEIRKHPDLRKKLQQAGEKKTSIDLNSRT